MYVMALISDHSVRDSRELPPLVHVARDERRRRATMHTCQSSEYAQSSAQAPQRRRTRRPG